MSLSIPPGSDFIFQVVKVNDNSWNVVDTRTQGVVANFATQSLARDDAVTRNQGAHG
jgi:hypothetical protein